MALFGFLGSFARSIGAFIMPRHVFCELGTLVSCFTPYSTRWFLLALCKKCSCLAMMLPLDSAGSFFSGCSWPLQEVSCLAMLLPLDSAGIQDSFCGFSWPLSKNLSYHGAGCALCVVSRVHPAFCDSFVFCISVFSLALGLWFNCMSVQCLCLP